MKSPTILLAFAEPKTDPIFNLAEEQRRLTALFENFEKQQGYDTKLVPNSTIQQVFDQTIKIHDSLIGFHYGGHAYEAGLLLEDKDRDPQSIDQEPLIKHLHSLHNLQFVFLNGCISYQLAQACTQKQVRIAIGTTILLNDQIALAFSERFYQSLLQNRTIFESFEDAKQYVISEHKPDKTVKGENDYRPYKHQKAGGQSPILKFPYELYTRSEEDKDLTLRELLNFSKLLPKKSSILSNPFPDPDPFIGRETDLENLEERLKTHDRVLVQGLGGIGKSTLLRKFFNQIAPKYDYALYLTVTESIDFALWQDRNIVLNLNLQDRLTDQFKENIDLIWWGLSQLKGTKILVIDNMPNLTENAETKSKLLGLNWKMVGSSREKIEDFESVPLQTLPIEKAADLFRTHYTHEYQADLVPLILEQVGCHTLAIELIAKNAQDLEWTLAKLHTELKEKGLKAQKYADLTVAHSPKRIENIFSYLLDVFPLENLSEAEQTLLTHYSVLPNLAVSAENWVILSNRDKDEITILLKKLNRKGWLIHQTEGYFLHLVLAEVLREKLQPNYEKCEVIIENLTICLKNNPYQNPLGKAKWLPFSNSILCFIVSENEIIAHLFNNVGMVYFHRGYYTQALVFFEKTLSIDEKRLPKDHTDLATCYNNIGLIYNQQGNYDQAITFFEKALMIREKILSYDHPNLIQSYNNVAVVSHNQGNYDKALKFYQIGLTIQEKTLPNDHPHLARSYNNIGTVYLSQGNYDRALIFCQGALMIQEKILPNDHPSLATSYSNMGLIYFKQHNYQQAFVFHHKALAIREKVLPADHPDLATSYNSLASLYYSMQNYAQAKIEMEKAIQIWQRSLPANHPNLRDALKGLKTIHAKLRGE